MNDTAARLDGFLAEMPIVAILRGLRTDEAEAMVQGLYDVGIRVAEVPLNSPDPFATIELLARRFGDVMSIGAGTVIAPEQVQRLADSGGAICVSPDTNPPVIAEALRLGMVPLPGCATATEAFTALRTGARHLKFFPAGGHAADIAALRSVLPVGVTMLGVGGVGPASMADLHRAGVAAFGIGSDIFKPGRSAAEAAERAAACIAALPR